MNQIIWGGALPIPAIELTTQPTPPFSLATWFREGQGLIIDFAAFFTASGNTRWWATSQRAGTDVGPTEGNLYLGPEDIPITRIQESNNGANILMNNNDPFSLAGHFGASGTTSQWTLRIQTASGIVESNSINTSGGGFCNFAIALADRAAIRAINDGTELIYGAYRLT